MTWLIAYSIVVSVALSIAVMFVRESGAKIRGLAQDSDNVLAVLEQRGWTVEKKIVGSAMEWEVNGTKDISVGRAWRLACARYDAKLAADKMVDEEMAR